MALSNARFRFRVKEITLIKHKLTEGDSVLVCGIRRIGKSWLMREVCVQLAEEGHQSHFIDTQDFQHPHELVGAVLSALPKKKKAKLNKIIAKGQILPARILSGLKAQMTRLGADSFGAEFRQGIIDYWQPLSDLIGDIIAEKDQPFILVLDELPFFIENLKNQGYELHVVNQLLASLRKWREAGLPMIIGGSISLENRLEVLKVPSQVLGGLFRVELNPFSKKEAREFLTELALRTRTFHGGQNQLMTKY